MKKVFILIALGSLLISCEKDYDCVITTEFSGNTSQVHYEFHGTSKEMKEFEESGSPSQTINCK